MSANPYPHDPQGCSDQCPGCEWAALDAEWREIDEALDARAALAASPPRLPDAILAILHEAGMLCDVCEERIASTQGQRHEAQLCEVCLEGEPDEDEYA